MDSLDYVMRDIDDLPQDVFVNQEDSIRNFIYFKNRSLNYRNRFREQEKESLGESSRVDEFPADKGEYLYSIRNAMKYAEYIIKKFTGNDPKLEKVMEKELDDLTKELIEFEDAN